MVPNTQSIKDRITFNKKLHRFEFRVFPNRKSKLDMDYYPLITPRSIHDLTDNIVNTFVSLVTREISRIPDSGRTDIDTIILDELCDMPVKTYRVYNTKDKPIGIIRSSATDDQLENIMLTWYPRARSYQEV